MKDSAENGWSRKRLVEIASISSGNSISARDRAGKYSSDNTVGRYFISTKDVGFDGNINHATDVAIPPEDQSSFKLAPKGSTLVCSEGGSAGRKVGLLKEDAHYGNKLFALAGGDEVLPEMIHYFCLTDDFVQQFEDRKTGLIGGVSLSKFQTIEMPLPPLEQQQRIVAVLDEAFEGLTRARAHAETNLQNARELFERFLGDQFLHGGVGNKTCTVGDLITLQRGFDITKKDQREGPFPVVSSGGIKSHHDIAMAKAPGVVIGRKGSIGSVYFIAEDFWPHDTTLWVKDFKGNDPQLIYYLMRGLSLIELDTGAANPSLNRNLVHPLVVSWPDENDQSKVAARIFEFEAQSLELQRHYSTKVQNLDDLRQSLLQKAFAGELT